MSKMYFRGLPTGLDVRRLNEAFPDIQVGAEILHEDIESAIGIKRSANRYRTVTVAWRRALLTERNLDLAAINGVGFRVLTADERINASVKGFRSGVRKQLRSVRRSDTVRTDDPVLMKKQDVLRRAGAVIATESALMMKEIEPPRAHAQTPRLVPRNATA